jgi:hypothetical protein
VYLGPHVSPEILQTYRTLMAEWLANIRQLPPQSHDGAATEPLIDEFVVGFMRFAEGYYVKHGRVTSTLDSIRAALRPLEGSGVDSRPFSGLQDITERRRRSTKRPPNPSSVADAGSGISCSVRFQLSKPPVRVSTKPEPAP